MGEGSRRLIGPGAFFAFFIYIIRKEKRKILAGSDRDRSRRTDLHLFYKRLTYS